VTPSTVGRPRAVLFDLLTALLDSWTLWNAVAGDAVAGRRWRAAYLKNTYAAGRYRPYEALVREAAVEVGLTAALADRLAERCGELAPWPEVAEVLGALRGRVPLAVVTNCSEALGRLAVSRAGIAFDAFVTAERAG
jgi:2-haloacid dehalogenase